ncbi:MAG: hypothetical protein IKE65_03330 [Clostridia bacterium]|nr:hypothetical protein [Clostridia bacterium]
MRTAQRGGYTITAREIMESAAARTAGALSDSEKLRALSELDNKIYEDIILRHEGAEAYMQPVAGGEYVHRAFPYTSDLQELIAPHRFRKMYIHYLCLEADLARDEIDRYTNDLILFHDAFDAFFAHYHQTHMPCCPAKIKAPRAFLRRDSHAQ